MIRQIATFEVDDLLLGLDILIVREIYRKLDLTPVYGAANSIRGLMNLRGRIVTIIDVNVCLGRSPLGLDDTRLLILKTDSDIVNYQREGLLENVELGNDIVGLVIHRMGDVLEVSNDEILPRPSNIDGDQKDLISGVLRLNEKLVMLIDATALLSRVNNDSVTSE